MELTYGFIVEKSQKKHLDIFVSSILLAYTKNIKYVAWDINNSDNIKYLNRNILNVIIFGRGTAWLDTGTHRGLLQASNFVEAIQNRQGLYIACIVEIAYGMGYINKEKLIELAQPLLKTDYGKYLIRISEMP